MTFFDSFRGSQRIYYVDKKFKNNKFPPTCVIELRAEIHQEDFILGIS